MLVRAVMVAVAALCCLALPSVDAQPGAASAPMRPPRTALSRAPAPAAALVRVEADRMSMACLYSIVAYGASKGAVMPVLTAALDEVDRIDRLMSHYKPESPLSQLNRDAARGPVVVEPELFDFVAEAIRYSTTSAGAFDITVGPLMKAWGFFRGEGRLPTDRELARARDTIGYQHVILDKDHRTIRFDREGVALDLGGIAKGYAVDRVMALLKSRGIDIALVSAGGSTLYAAGAPPDAQAWEIEIQDPLDANKVAFKLPLRDRALSMSGSSEKMFEIDGVRYGHIMDPRTGRPVQGVLSVVVLSDTGTNGDALDNALFVLGVERSRTLLRSSSPTTDAYFFLPTNPHENAHDKTPWRSVHIRPAAGRP